MLFLVQLNVLIIWKQKKIYEKFGGIPYKIW